MGIIIKNKLNFYKTHYTNNKMPHNQLHSEEEIEQINNHAAPVASQSVVAPADFAFLMRRSGQRKNKSANFKEAKKADMRRNQKYAILGEKYMKQQLEEQLERERIEWAPQGKEDAKFQQKMEQKLAAQAPSRKAINQMLYEEEQREMAQSKKSSKKSSWGKKKLKYEV